MMAGIYIRALAYLLATIYSPIELSRLIFQTQPEGWTGELFFIWSFWLAGGLTLVGWEIRRKFPNNKP